MTHRHDVLWTYNASLDAFSTKYVTEAISFSRRILALQLLSELAKQLPDQYQSVDLTAVKKLADHGTETETAQAWFLPRHQSFFGVDYVQSVGPSKATDGLGCSHWATLLIQILEKRKQQQ